MPAGIVERSRKSAGSVGREWVHIGGVEYVTQSDAARDWTEGDFVTFKVTDAAQRGREGMGMTGFLCATEIVKADPATTTLYDHAYTIAFSVKGSTDAQGEDVNAAMLRAALFTRIADIDAVADAPHEWLESTGAPFDSMEQGS